MNELNELLDRLAAASPEIVATQNMISASCDIAKAMILCSCVAYDRMIDTDEITVEILMNMTDFIADEMHTLKFSQPTDKQKALNEYFKKVMFETRSRAERRLK